MHSLRYLLAVLASTAVLAAPLPQDKNVCVGSSFSPTDCDSPGAQSINVDPDLDISPEDNLKIREPVPEPEPEAAPDSDDTCVGSSFAPTNCNSPGAQSINVDPDVDVSPTVNLAKRAPAPQATKSVCVGSSFSPTDCDSPGAQSINVDPDLDLSPTTNL